MAPCAQNNQQEPTLSTDDTSSRHQRLAHLSKVAMPPAGSAEAERMSVTFDKLNSDPRHRKAMKEMHERAIGTLNAQLKSGAGYAADQTVRHFLAEFKTA